MTAGPFAQARLRFQSNHHAVLLPFPGRSRSNIEIPDDVSQLARNDDQAVRENYRVLLQDMRLYLGKSSTARIGLPEFQRYVRTHVREGRPSIVPAGSESPEVWDSIFSVFASYAMNATSSQPLSTHITAAAAPVYPWSFDGDAASVTLEVESTAEQCMDTGTIVTNGPTVHVPRSGTCSNTVVALRFTHVPIETRGSTRVHAARLRFIAGVSTGAISLEIFGEAENDASGFLPPFIHPEDRERTAATAEWHMGEHDDWTLGNAETSADVSSVVSEVINRPGWHADNAIVLLVKGHNLMEALNSLENQNARRYRTFQAVPGLSLQITWRPEDSVGSTMESALKNASANFHAHRDSKLPFVAVAVVTSVGVAICFRSARERYLRHGGKRQYKRVPMQGIEMDARQAGGEAR
eukprot:SAG31_NODE_1231_length_9212_cov_2.857566_1_plen_410_part_00